MQAISETFEESGDNVGKPHKESLLSFILKVSPTQQMREDFRECLHMSSQPLSQNSWQKCLQKWWENYACGMSLQAAMDCISKLVLIKGYL
jgi:hypothetical protein